MKVRRYRSWPLTFPEGRPCVLDDLPRLIVDDEYNYRPALASWLALETDAVGLYLVAWDIAAGPEDWEALRLATEAFEGRRVVVAPYHLYPVSTGLSGPVTAHDHDGPGCFGFGMVYLPAHELRAWFAEHPADATLTSLTFSTWYASRCAYAVTLADAARPVHLHY